MRSGDVSKSMRETSDIDKALEKRWKGGSKRDPSLRQVGENKETYKGPDSQLGKFTVGRIFCAWSLGPNSFTATAPVLVSSIVSFFWASAPFAQVPGKSPIKTKHE